MTQNRGRCFCEFPVLVLLLTLSACGEGEAQRSASEPSAVRSAVLKTSGSVSGEYSAADASEAKIIGRCDPGTFANFGVRFNPTEGWRMVGVTVMTKDEIKAGQTGPIQLDWAQVSFTDNERNATEFRGPAELVITSHDTKAPRMSGSVKGRLKGYGGMLSEPVPPDQFIDIDFAFDIDAACGASK